MIYVPEFNEGNCLYIVSSDVIRVYDSVPQHNTTISYKDYYIKSNYISNSSVATFSNYSTLPVCHTTSDITTEVYYRNDFADILIIFVIMCFVCFWIPWKILCRLFRRFN